LNPSNNRSPVSAAALDKAAAVFLALILFVGCQTVKAQEVTVMRVAHRGGAALAPENTLASFAAGLDADADALEMDVHLSRDGVLMVIHDALLERTVGQKGEVSDYDATALALFNAAVAFKGAAAFGVQKIPTLDEVLDLVEKKATRPVGLQIEIKQKSDGSRYAGLEEKLVQKLRDRGRIGSTVVISFDFPSLARVRELEPSLRRGALISKKYMTEIGAGGPKKVADEMVSLGVEYVGINYQYLSKTLYDEFRSRKLGVGAWTVNDPKAMERFAAMGVDFITSDDPVLLKRTLSPVP
jgi:glycerophosphoryl diester phosphodiesterase